MNPPTNAASTKDWIEASKAMTIQAYIALPPVLPIEAERPFIEGDFEIPVLSLDILPGSPCLAAELDAWDALSDEALANFEATLG